jgi:BTB/POZ domain
MNLECEYRLHRLLDDFGDGVGYGCFVNEAIIAEPKTEIKEFVGQHEKGYTNSRVDSIEFAETVITFFPRGLVTHFPNLSELTIYKCGLKMISMEDLQGLENLTSLSLVENKLVTLPDNLLMNTPKLQRISFCGNLIENMNSLFLQPIIENDIKLIDFRCNKRIDSFYESKQNQPGSTETVLELMNIIDASCDTTFNIELWTEGLASDFLIVVGTKEYRVQKNVLSMKSQLFAEMFEDHKDLCEFKFTDFSIKTVDDFLRFIYGIEDQTDNPLELFRIASEFKVQKLKLKCEERFVKDINEWNVMEVFSLGHQIGSENVKIAAFKFIKKMIPRTHLPDEYMNAPEMLNEFMKAFAKAPPVPKKRTLAVTQSLPSVIQSFPSIPKRRLQKQTARKSADKQGFHSF